MTETWEMFFALGDPYRLEMVQRLVAEGPMPMSKLGESMPFSRQAASKHLQTLRSAGLVTWKKRGRENVVEVVPENVHLTRMFLARLENDWDERLGRLIRMVEGQ